MSRVNLARVATVILGVVACQTDQRESLALRWQSSPTQGGTCDLTAIGRTDLADSTAWELTTLQRVGGQSAEGASFDVFTAQDTLKMLIVTYYGEMGNTVLNYRFASPSDYVVSRTESHYARPIYAGPVETVSRIHHYYYYCAGQLTDTEREAHATSIDDILRDVLAELNP